MGKAAWYMALAALAAVLAAMGCATARDSRGAPGNRAAAPATAVSDGRPFVAERAVMPTAQLHRTESNGTQAPIAEGQETQHASPPLPAEAAVPSAGMMPYAIGPGDVLEFRSYQDAALDREVVVRYDGHVSLPGIPDVAVSGLTREEALEHLRGAYSALFRDPQVDLIVTQASSKTFQVMGDVSRPNVYPYTRRITVLEAINMAGGPRVQSDRLEDAFVGVQGTLTKAFIIRTGEPEREVIECDLRNLTQPGAHPSNTPVYPGDIVYVPEGVNLVYVLGEVRNPRVFQLVEGTTLLQLLARAGGPIESTARMRHVMLLREIDATNSEILVVDIREILRTGQDIRLVPGDVIYIPRKVGLRLQEFVARFTGSVSPLLSLYTQAWEAYYTRDRLKAVIDGFDVNTQGNLLAVLQQLNTLLPPP
jgi:polysaccharide biosynthesis/export protein